MTGATTIVNPSLINSVILPGSTITLASGTGGTGALTSAVVRKFDSTTGTITVDASAITANSSTAPTLLFGPIAATTLITPGAGVSATSSASNGLTQTVTLASGTNSLMIGAAVSGTGIGAGATIASITSPTTFTVTSTGTGAGGAAGNLTITTPAAPTAQSLVVQTTSGSTAATLIGSGATPGLYIGQQLVGPGLPFGTTVQSITPIAGSTTNYNITLSQNATVSGVANEFASLNPVGNSLVSSNITAAGVVTVPSTTGLTVGMSVNGPGIPAGSVVGSIANGTTVNLVNSAHRRGGGHHRFGDQYRTRLQRAASEPVCRPQPAPSRPP